MSDREKAIRVLEELPETISMKDILIALNTIFEVNNRIDSFNEEEAITSDEFKKEIEEW